MSDASRKIMALDEHRPNARLSGRRIVITGAASGIGWRTSEVFAGEGAKLSLFDRSAEGLREIASRTGGEPFAVDVTDEAAVMRATEAAAAQMGGIDGIVNAAGIVIRGPVSDVSAEMYRRVLDVNLMGPYIVVRSCLRARLPRS